MPTEELTIGEVARRSGVATSALRFYEERGLITSERAGSGHRRFPRAVLRRIAFIVFAQRIGLTLEEIGDELAKLPPDRAPTRRDWSKLSSGWSSRIDDRIAELERLKAGLTECIGCGCLSLERCRLANPGDRAAGWGQGRGTGSATGRLRARAGRGGPRAPRRGSAQAVAQAHRALGQALDRRGELEGLLHQLVGALDRVARLLPAAFPSPASARRGPGFPGRPEASARRWRGAPARCGSSARPGPASSAAARGAPAAIPPSR